MKETKIFHPRGFYLFESLASGNTSYFESEEEIRVFRIFLVRYLKKYVDIKRTFLSSEGYQVLIRIRGEAILRKLYKLRCNKKGIQPNKDFLKEVWRIVSDQVRIFHSVYAKWINRNRDRQGVLVQCRYKKYYFESKNSIDSYISQMEKGKEIKGQKNKRFRIAKKWKKAVDWLKIRSMEFIGEHMGREFQAHVVGKIIKNTLSLHSPPP